MARFWFAYRMAGILFAILGASALAGHWLRQSGSAFPGWLAGFVVSYIGIRIGRHLL